MHTAAWLCLCFVVFAMLSGCAMGTRSPGASQWAIAIHGGAGTLSKTAPAEEVAAYEQALQGALAKGVRVLERGGTSMDACEEVVRALEEHPGFNAGVGAAFTADGTHELDACVMDGEKLACGAVAGVTTVKSPVGLARMVMTKTKHVLLAGKGAEEFATLQGVPRVPNSAFDTEKRRKMLEEWRAEQNSKTSASLPSRALHAHGYGTVGCVALDQAGNLAAATSTGGLTGKRWGRVGDAPIVGAGTYANNSTCAVSCTGTGEQFIRHVIAKTVSDRMELAGESLDAATRHVVFKTLNPDDGGLIAVSKRGEIAMPYNSEGMFRGCADSGGRFEVAIWDVVRKGEGK
jgi:beta-aspartyl-peptidase (threonine type)